jgi:hypothetical protein
MKMLALDLQTRFISVRIPPDVEDLIDQGCFISLQGSGWWGDDWAPNDTTWEFNSEHPGQIKVVDELMQEFQLNSDSDDLLTFWH